MTKDPARDALRRTVADWAPGSVLVVADGDVPDFPAADVTRLAPARAREALEHLGRFDAAVVLAGLPAAELEVLLGRLRNVHAARVAVLAPDAGDGPMRALAFEPVAGAAGLWTFDIDAYNRPREWNSPEDWAHPENFDKYRW